MTGTVASNGAPARRSTRLNGSASVSSNGSGGKAKRSSTHQPSTADFDADGDSDPDSSVNAAMLHTGMSDSSMVDPTAIEEKAIEGVRQLKRVLAGGKDDASTRQHKQGKQAGQKLSSGLEGVELLRGTSGSVCADGEDEWKWGRAMNNDWASAGLAFGMMSVVPWIVLLMLHSCQYHQCSIQASLQQAMKEGQSAARAAAEPHPPGRARRCPAAVILLDLSLSTMFRGVHLLCCRRGMALAAFHEFARVVYLHLLVSLPAGPVPLHARPHRPRPAHQRGPHTAVPRQRLERVVVQPRLSVRRRVRAEAVPRHYHRRRVVRSLRGAQRVRLLLDAGGLLQGLAGAHTRGHTHTQHLTQPLRTGTALDSR